MFGGVADRYKLYTLIGEPFKDGKYLYIMARPPFSKGAPEKIRWYTDAKHGKSGKSKYEKPIWEVFGCKSEQDSLQVVRKSHLLESQNEAFFSNWERGYKWRGCALLGGCWYAPMGAELVPGVPLSVVEIVPWSVFYKEAN